MTVAAGDTPSADALNDPAGTTLAYGERTGLSSGSASTTSVPVLRLDAIPVVNGRQYEIVMGPCVIGGTVAGDLVEVVLYVSMSGAATTSSTHHRSMAEGVQSSSGSQRVTGTTWDYIPSATGNLSVLLAMRRGAGTGTVTIGHASASQYYVRMWVRDCGLAPGDTGVDL